ncbi:3-hydroxyacyl-ACP dehydratase FabZ [Clostridium culturomicium]|uniref:3-hydroxyacyl-ACP dehydratase FabZ n=1 Tax=Clostridium culturomicium TaxID=1499683 RepID=UPI0005A7371B|nr:3-hydroxyacyl-ACP dehydratase FabZ [Clostridium culturomicium]
MEDTLKTEKTISLNIKEIQEIIPHRYPFLFVDSIESLEPLKRAVGYKNVTMNEYFFQGHFPQEPVLPGVIIIEALAQVGAIALLYDEKFRGKIAYFGGIKNARFREKVVPGDRLRLEVEIIKMKGPMGIGQATAKVGDKVVCQAELTFAVGV